MTSELVTARHLSRKAVIYIRQSTPQQVAANGESLRLQYALRQRAQGLGWHEADVEVIDTDLGRSGATAAHREGFRDLIARVTLGEVGIILSYEVTRLARNCSDWYPLLDLCGYRRCLIGDRDGVYDPGSADGRLLLGLKGTISEVELHTLRGRLTAGLLSKAERGELALPLPAGLVRGVHGVVVKHPDREVQERVSLVFATFLELGSVGKVLRSFRRRTLAVPRLDRFGEVAWRTPTDGMIAAVLKNPAYAGAFVYGRTRSCHATYRQRQADHHALPDGGVESGREGPVSCLRRVGRFRADPGYAARQPRRVCTQPDARRAARRRGAAAGQRLVRPVRPQDDRGVQGRQPLRLQLPAAEPRWAAVPAPACRPDRRARCGRVLCRGRPGGAGGLGAGAGRAAAGRGRARPRRGAAGGAAALPGAARRAAVQLLAERQFNRVDPDNRLVASELEHRWEAALRELRQAEEALASRRASRTSPDTLTPEERDDFLALGPRLPALWRQPGMDRARKKALLRCLIDKVILHRTAPERIGIRIVWRGGEISEEQVEPRVYALHALSRGAEMQARILELARQGLTDAEAATVLTEEGYRSPRCCSHVLARTVQVLRQRHRVLRGASRTHPRHIPGRLTMAELARRVQVSRCWIERRIWNGTIVITRDATAKRYLFPDTEDTVAALLRLKSGEVNRLDLAQNAN